jgi:hypothetical protein
MSSAISRIGPAVHHFIEHEQEPFISSSLSMISITSGKSTRKQCALTTSRKAHSVEARLSRFQTIAKPVV